MCLCELAGCTAAKTVMHSDVAFPEKYVTGNFRENFRKFSVEQEKCIYS